MCFICVDLNEGLLTIPEALKEIKKQHAIELYKDLIKKSKNLKTKRSLKK